MRKSEVRVLSRERQPRWFSLVAGGYGFVRRDLLRHVAAGAPPARGARGGHHRFGRCDDAVLRRVEGCLYGDFQFVIDHADPRFCAGACLPVTGPWRNPEPPITTART